MTWCKIRLRFGLLLVHVIHYRKSLICIETEKKKNNKKSTLGELVKKIVIFLQKIMNDVKLQFNFKQFER